MRRRFIIELLLFYSIALSASADISFKCPDGVGSKKGDEPRMSYSPNDGGGVIVCGNQLQGVRGGWARMNQFEVLEVGFRGKPKVLTRANDREYYNVWAGYDEGVVLDRLVRLPLKDGEDPTYVTVTRTIIKCRRRNCQKHAPVCALGKLEKNIQSDVVEHTRALLQKTKSGVKSDDKTLSARLLVRALVGDSGAANLLKNFDTALLVADGDSAEILEEHQDILKVVTRLGCVH